MIQSVDRAIRILTILQGSRRMSLSEIATQLALPPSTVHGIIKTLAAHRMVEQEHDSGRYRLGPAVLLLGNVYLESLELSNRAMRWSEDLAHRTGHAVRVGIPMVDEVIVVHHEPRPDGTRQMREVGMVLPMHATALGKALLAFRPEDRARCLDPEYDLRPMTGETVTDPELLTKELDATMATGIATESDEAILGESGLAAPLFDTSGRAVGAVGVVIPSTAYPTGELVPDAVRQAARNITRELGSSRWPVPPG